MTGAGRAKSFNTWLLDKGTGDCIDVGSIGFQVDASASVCCLASIWARHDRERTFWLSANGLRERGWVKQREIVTALGSGRFGRQLSYKTFEQWRYTGRIRLCLLLRIPNFSGP